jgi:hypothetical protein
MCKASILGLLLIVVVAGGCAHSPHPLVGTWQMIKYQGGPAHDPPNTKILNETHFAFGHLTRDGGVFAGGGRFEAEDGIYKELIEYHSIPELVGLTIKFQYHLEDDLWYHKGEFDVGDRHYHIDEVWQRVEEIDPTERNHP